MKHRINIKAYTLFGAQYLNWSIDVLGNIKLAHDTAKEHVQMIRTTDGWLVWITSKITSAPWEGNDNA